MKNLLLYLAFFCCPLSLFAQATFFKWYQSDNYEYIYDVAETNSGSYILSGCFRDMDLYGAMHGYLLKITNDGEKINEEIRVNIGDTTRGYACIFPDPRRADTIIVIGNEFYTDKAGMPCQTTSFLHYTENLVLAGEKKYLSASNYSILPQRYVFTDDSLFFIHSTVCTNSPSFQPKGWIISKYNIDFDSLATFYDTQSVINAGLIYDDKIQMIKFFDISLNMTKLSYFNKDLQLLSTKKYPFQIAGNMAYVLPFNDTSYLITGNKYSNPPAHEIRCMQFNSFDDTVRSVFYENSPDTVLYAGAMQNTALVGDKIFIAGFYNIDPSIFPWQDMPDWIQITRIDTNFKVIDHHFYGGDAVYIPYRILTTSDGGALVVGSRFDYTQWGTWRMHAFALKVNDHGLITETPENPEMRAHDAIVYPNPGSDNLIVQSGPQVNGAVFRMYDMQGRQVMEEQLDSTLLRLSSGNLAAGTYPWQIILNNKVIESGKWVKGK